LADDENLRRKLGEKGKVIVREYSWEMSAKKQSDLYEELYESCIN
jgi:glycosyltransferase involved in cell wall biosynthesis